MICKNSPRIKSTLVLFIIFLCCGLVFSGIDGSIFAEDIFLQETLAKSNWAPDVIASLTQHMYLSPGGFLLSGRTIGNFLYGVAILPQVSKVDFLPALQLQATRMAFYDLVKPLEQVQLPAFLQEDFHFYQLSQELVYNVRKFEEVQLVAEDLQACFVQIQKDQVHYEHNVEPNFAQFSVYLYDLARLSTSNGQYELARQRFDWLFNCGEVSLFYHELVLSSAELYMKQNDSLSACLAVLPFLEYDDDLFFNLFSPEKIDLILEILEGESLYQAAFEIGALAMILYPEYPEFELRLSRLLELREAF